MQLSYIRLSVIPRRAEQRTDRMNVNSCSYTVIDIVPTYLLAYHSRDWAWFKLAQPIAGAQAGPRLLALLGVLPPSMYRSLLFWYRSLVITVAQFLLLCCSVFFHLS